MLPTRPHPSTGQCSAPKLWSFSSSRAGSHVNLSVSVAEPLAPLSRPRSAQNWDHHALPPCLSSLPRPSTAVSMTCVAPLPPHHRQTPWPMPTSPHPHPSLPLLEHRRHLIPPWWCPALSHPLTSCLGHPPHPYTL